MVEKWLLSIDFGTVNTVAATRSLPDGRTGELPPELVAFGPSNRLPSAVFCGDDGALRVGDEINQSSRLAFDRLEPAPKRRLGLEKTLILGNRQLETTDLVAAVLTYAAKTAIQLFDGAPPAAVNLTRPAMWGSTRTNALRAAALQAGLPIPQLIDEPVAAATALAFRGALPQLEEGETVIVYDFGGGTFDVTLLRMNQGHLTVMDQPGGNDDLGGENIDDDLFFFVLEQLPGPDQTLIRGEADGADPLATRRAGLRLREGVRVAKERLRHESRFTFELGQPFSLESWTLTRAELHDLALPRIEATFTEVDRTLTRNALSRSDVSALCLVGGSSSLTLVGRLAAQIYDCRIIQHGDPKALVAYGAALVARDPTLGLGEVSSGANHAMVAAEAQVQQRAEAPTMLAAPPELRSPQTAPASLPHDRDVPGVTALPEPTSQQQVMEPRPPVAHTAPSPPEPAPPQGVAFSVASSEPAYPAPELRNDDVMVSLSDCAAVMNTPLAPEIHLTRLLVAAGAYVGLGAPLVEVASDARQEPFVLRSPVAGLMKQALARPATTTYPDAPAFRFGRPDGFALRSQRRNLAGQAGIVLYLQAADRARIRAEAVTVELAGHRHFVWVGASFFFPTPPGSHMMVVNVVAGGRVISSASHLYRVKLAPHTPAFLTLPTHGSKTRLG
jgi:Hsp70 protein